jgi:hypothetical protein
MPSTWPTSKRGIRAVKFYYGITHGVLKQTRLLLDDPKLCREVTEYTFKVGRQRFSYRRLRETLEPLLQT